MGSVIFRTSNPRKRCECINYKSIAGHRREDLKFTQVLRTSKLALEDLLVTTCGRPKFSALQPVDLREYSTRYITENQLFSLSDWKISYPRRQALFPRLMELIGETSLSHTIRSLVKVIDPDASARETFPGCDLPRYNSLK